MQEGKRIKLHKWTVHIKENDKNVDLSIVMNHLHFPSWTCHLEGINLVLTNPTRLARKKNPYHLNPRWKNLILPWWTHIQTIDMHHVSYHGSQVPRIVL